MSRLRRFQGVVEGLFAVAIDAVTDQDEDVMAGLLRHDFGRSEINCVVERAAPVAHAPLILALVAAVAAGVLFAEVARAKLRDRVVQLVAGRGRVLQQIDFAIVLDHKGAVIGAGERVIDEVDGAEANIADLRALVWADLPDDAEHHGRRLRERKGLDGLDVAVVRQRNVAGLEVLHRVAFFVDHGDGQGDGHACGGRGRWSSSRRRTFGRWIAPGREWRIAPGRLRAGKAGCGWESSWLVGSGVDHPLDVSTEAGVSVGRAGQQPLRRKM